MKSAVPFLAWLPLFSALLYLTVWPGSESLTTKDHEVLSVNSLSEQAASGYKYQGLDKCASVCHSNDELGYQYNIIKDSKHADAFEVLGTKKAKKFAREANVPGDPKESQVCLKCHTTAAGLDPSSYLDTYRKEDGITCEACHKGPLSAQTVMPGEKTCLGCHSNPVHKVNAFVFAERLKKIAHPKKEVLTDSGKIAEVAVSAGKFGNGDGRTHYIGENFGGGIVFYTFDNGRHGLVASEKDLGSGIKWHNGTDKTTGSTADGLYAGESNTNKIYSGLSADNPEGIFAARLCADYSVTADGITYDDWYLPSRSELNLLYLKKDIVGGFARGYWSSTEVDSSRAWVQYFNSGRQFSYNGKSYGGYVRAIRGF